MRIILIYLLFFILQSAHALDPNATFGSITNPPEEKCTNCKIEKPPLKKEDCSTSLTCEDKINLGKINKILLSNISSSEKNLKRKAFIINNFLDTIPKSSADRLRLHLISEGMKNGYISSKLNKEEAYQDLERLKKFTPHMERYVKKIQWLDEFVEEKMVQNIWSVYAEQAFCDHPIIPKAPDCMNTRSVQTIQTVGDYRKVLLLGLDQSFSTETPEQREKIRRQLINYLMKDEEYFYAKFETVDNQIKGNLGAIKTGYAFTLGALAIAATGGMATPHVSGYLNFAVNTGGWFLATDGSKRFVESYIDYSDNPDMGYWCALSKNGIQNFGHQKMMEGAFIGGGLATTVGFTVNNLTGPLGRVISVSGLGAISYLGYDALVSDPGKQVEKLESLKEKIPGEKSCIDHAIKKVRAGQSVDIAGLALALGGVGQAGLKTVKSHPNSPIKKYLDSIEEKKLLKKHQEEVSQYLTPKQKQKISEIRGLKGQGHVAKIPREKMLKRLRASVERLKEASEINNESEKLTIESLEAKAKFNETYGKAEDIMNDLIPVLDDPDFLAYALEDLQVGLMKYMKENNLPLDDVTDEIFQKFIIEEGRKFGLKQTKIPSGCCDGARKFSKFIGTLIFDEPFRGSSHDVYPHAIQMVATYRMLSKKYTKPQIDAFFKVIKDDSFHTSPFSSEHIWFYLFDSVGPVRGKIKVGYTTVNPNITSPEFLSEMIRQGQFIPGNY